MARLTTTIKGFLRPLLLLLILFAPSSSILSPPILYAHAPSVGKQEVPMFYCYRVDDSRMESKALIHDSVIESGYKNIALGAYQSTLGSSMQKVLDEIDWIRTWNENGKIWIIQYDTTTRTSPEGNYEYHPLSEWENNFKILAENGVEMFIINVGSGSRWYNLNEPNSWLITINNLAKKYGVKFGFYDGDGLHNIVNFNKMKAKRIYVWSDIYMNGNKPYLASKCGKNYPYLVTLFWSMVPLESWQQRYFKSRADFTNGLDFLKNLNSYGNVVEVYDFKGIMPEWGYVA